MTDAEIVERLRALPAWKLREDVGMAYVDAKLEGDPADVAALLAWAEALESLIEETNEETETC